MRDYTAQIITDVQVLIERLAEQESIARKTRREERRQEEDKCNRLRTQLLEQADASSVYLYLNATKIAQDVDFRTQWQTNASHMDKMCFLKQWKIEQLYQEHWGAPVLDLSILPPYTFYLQFTFTLAKPYLSQDDKFFYIIDNPVVRDKVFQLPIVRPTSWKGCLRAALWQMGYKKDEVNEQMRRLFGDIRDNGCGQSGRLRFYPTFFTKTGLEVINPHDRREGVGKNPILFESVCIDDLGTFTLLYIPFDLIGKPENKVCEEIKKDVPLVIRGLKAMLCSYGFGAKISSGFGLAKDKIKNISFSLNIQDDPDKSQIASSPVEPEYPVELQDFIKKFPDEDFQLKPNDWRKKHGASTRQRTDYKQMRAAYLQYKKQQAVYEQAVSEWESTVNIPALPYVKRTFMTMKFDELLQEVQKLVTMCGKEVLDD